MRRTTDPARPTSNRLAPSNGVVLAGHPPSAPPSISEFQLLLATAENRRRLERIKLAWQNLVDELADGAKRKHAFAGDLREERCLEMLAAMLPDSRAARGEVRLMSEPVVIYKTRTDALLPRDASSIARKPLQTDAPDVRSDFAPVLDDEPEDDTAEPEPPVRADNRQAWLSDIDHLIRHERKFVFEIVGRVIGETAADLRDETQAAIDKDRARHRRARGQTQRASGQGLRVEVEVARLTAKLAESTAKVGEFGFCE